MNDRINGRATRVRAGIVAAGAAAFIAGGGLLLGGFGSGHQAAPAGVVNGQRVAFGSPGASPDDAQCAAIVQKINAGQDIATGSADQKTALACHDSQLQDDPTRVTDVCLAVNAHARPEDLNFDIDLEILCADEPAVVAKTAATTDPQPSASPDGTDPSASPDDTDPSADPDGTDPSADPDGTDPSADPDGTDPAATPDDAKSSDCPGGTAASDR